MDPSPAPSTAPVADLTGWTVGRFAAGGLEHPVYEKGSGPGVILIPELPGATPEVLGFGQHLVDCGFHVVMPSPFGEVGRPQTVGYTLRTLARLCVSAEFRAFAVGAERGFSGWLRALARDVAARTPGAGVGVIGMCFTGGFALAAAVDDAVLAPVVAEPAVPFPISRTRRADPGVSPAELVRVQERARSEGLCVLGLRFSEDSTAPRERFATIAAALGDAFEVIELDSRPGNPGGFPRSAHSVLTSEVREVPGHPSLIARERTVAFLREQLGGLTVVFELLAALFEGAIDSSIAERRLKNGQVECGLRATAGRVSNIGTEWSVGIATLRYGHLHFEPTMGVVGSRDVEVTGIRSIPTNRWGSQPFADVVMLDTPDGALEFALVGWLVAPATALLTVEGRD